MNFIRLFLTESWSPVRPRFNLDLRISLSSRFPLNANLQIWPSGGFIFYFIPGNCIQVTFYWTLSPVRTLTRVSTKRHFIRNQQETKRSTTQCSMKNGAEDQWTRYCIDHMSQSHIIISRTTTVRLNYRAVWSKYYTIYYTILYSLRGLDTSS
jgi:hypothetical protein